MIRPAESELRQGEAATWGPLLDDEPRARPATIRRWTAAPNAAGTMLGFIDVEAPSGLVIKGIKLMVGPAEKHWLAMPSQKLLDRAGNPRLDANGKPTWAQVVEFANRSAADKFRDIVLNALRQQHPEAFERHSPAHRPALARRAPARSRPAPSADSGPMPDARVDDLWVPQ